VEYGVSFNKIGGIHMTRRYDILHAIILLLFLIIANFIGNAIIKGILLLLFSSILMINTTMKLVSKKNGKLRSKFFYCVLLLLDVILAAASIYVIAISIIEL
jgi:hypothetical protein